MHMHLFHTNVLNSKVIYYILLCQYASNYMVSIRENLHFHLIVFDVPRNQIIYIIINEQKHFVKKIQIISIIILSYTPKTLKSAVP